MEVSVLYATLKYFVSKVKFFFTNVKFLYTLFIVIRRSVNIELTLNEYDRVHVSQNICIFSFTESKECIYTSEDKSGVSVKHLIWDQCYITCYVHVFRSTGEALTEKSQPNIPNPKTKS